MNRNAAPSHIRASRHIRVRIRAPRRITAVEGAFVTAVLVAALAAALALASPASAGGPTSVLLVSPCSGEAEALYATSGEYAQLEKQLSPEGATPPPSPGSSAVGSGRQINVTWLSHDVSVWRVDRVYPETPGDKVWIHTASPQGADGQGYWHAAKDPERLLALLDKVGVMGAESDKGLDAVDYPPGFAEGEPEATESPSTSASGASDGTDGETVPGWPGVPGAATAGTLLGCGGTLLARRWSERRALPDPGPRQQLTDLTPDMTEPRLGLPPGPSPGSGREL